MTTFISLPTAKTIKDHKYMIIKTAKNKITFIEK